MRSWGACRRLLTVALGLVVVVPGSAMWNGTLTAAAASTPACVRPTFNAAFENSAVIADGIVYMWGRNFEGELGSGFTGGINGTPAPVSSAGGLTTATGVWTAFNTSFATDPQGNLWAWGDNAFGERGNSNGNNVPEPVAGPANVVSVGAGSEHTVVVTADGAIWGWGLPEDMGLPGFGSVSPTVLPGPGGVIKAAAGDPYTIVLTSSGTVYAVGGNQKGQLGLGSGIDVATSFTPVPGVSGATDIAVSDSVGTEFTLVVDGSGHIIGFGSNFYGQLGTPASSAFQYDPVQIPGIDSVKLVAAGNGHTLAVKTDGTLWAWGANDNGQLGIGSTANTSTPTQVPFPAGVQIVDVAAAGAHSMALDSNGNVWAWGRNGTGEIGNGFTIGPPVLTPVKLNLAGAVSIPCNTGSAPPRYLPRINGYSIPNDGKNLTTPTFEQMAKFYPRSAVEMYIPFTSIPTPTAWAFYHTLFVPFYMGYFGSGGGLCFGMAASSQFLYNSFPNSTAYDDFSALSTPFSANWGPSPSPGDTTIGDLIYRYHSRQLAAAAALAAINSWEKTQDLGGNAYAMSVIKQVTDTGKTEWVGLGPSRTLNVLRFGQLFNESHAVLAYNVEPDQNRIDVYDPDAPGDNFAYLQLDSAGGVELFRNGQVAYGGGVQGSTDWGQPNEWTLMPLPDVALSAAGNIPGQDNVHWVLDAGALAIVHNGGIDRLNGLPIFRINGRGPDDSTQLLAAGTGLTTGVTADGPGSLTSEFAGPNALQATQTDAGAAGSAHHVSISADATAVTLSGASTAEQFTLELDGDFLDLGFGRRITIGGAALGPSTSLSASVDPSHSTITLGSTAALPAQVSLLLEQVSQEGGSTTVNGVVPAGGGRGTTYVYDWTNVAGSLVFEEITAADGTITGVLLQDNPAQRQAQLSTLFQSAGDAINQVTDAGIRSALQSQLANAARQASAQPAAAARILDAMRRLIAAQSGKAIDRSLAESLDSTLIEATGLLRASAI